MIGSRLSLRRQTSNTTNWKNCHQRASLSSVTLSPGQVTVTEPSVPGSWPLKFTKSLWLIIFVHNILVQLAILGAFAKLPVDSSCLSVRPHEKKNLGSHWTDFHKTSCTNIFQKSVDKIQVWLKSDKNNGYFTWRSMIIYDSSSLNSS